MAVEVEGLDVELLRSEIQRTYAAVSGDPDRDFMFPTGRAWAQDLGYPAELLGRVPETSCESFAGVGTVTIVEGSAEQLPFADGSFDVIISNGVIDLIPDKDAVFSEIVRVLRPGGRIQLADVTIQRPVSEEGKRNIDLWAG